MMNDSIKSKKVKSMEKQPDIKQFMFKKMRSQGASPSSPTPRDNDPFYSSSFSSPKTQETEMGLSDSNSNTSLCEEEELEYNFGHALDDPTKSEYKVCLSASLKCLRFLLRQGLAYYDHDEYEESNNRGNFLELLTWLAENDEDVRKVIFKTDPENNQMASLPIQEDLINCCAKETTMRITEELGDDYFAILVDKSIDVSQKEHLALFLRYVGETGMVIERFLGLVHVSDTAPLSLQWTIESLLIEHSLDPSKIRGQGYNGVNTMMGGMNDLKTLIIKDTPCAYYVYCFANQLQSTIVAVAKRNIDYCWFFEILANLLNLIGVSCKRREIIQECRVQKIVKAFEMGEIESERYLNQELSLRGDTCWGSYYKIILNVVSLFSTIIEVVEMIGRNSSSSDDQVTAQVNLHLLESFDFVFLAHLMLAILGYTADLSIALQRKEQDIVNVISLVSLTKRLLQKMRDDGWETFFDTVLLFCVKNDIEVPDMNASYVPLGRSERFVSKSTNLHHFRVEVFLGVIDLQLQELNHQFDEVNMEMLRCMACLNPVHNFSSFDKEKLLRFAGFYPSEFSNSELITLGFQLDVFIANMKIDERFQNLNDLGALSTMLVKTRKHLTFSQVYLLLKLMLILPVTNANVDRVPSTMNYMKNKMRTSLGNQVLNDCLVTFIERDVFLQVSDDEVINRFQDMKTRSQV